MKREVKLTDTELIQATIAGNQMAFRKLVERYRSQVAAAVIGMLGHCAEAEDVGQEVFIRFYKSLKSFKGKSTVGTYITRIAMNLSLNELKRRQRGHRTQLVDPSTFDQSANSANNSDFETKQLIRNAVMRLAPEQRSVVVLRLIKGHSTKETAEFLEIPLGTVLSRLARGQRALRDYLSTIEERGIHEKKDAEVSISFPQ